MAKSRIVDIKPSGLRLLEDSGDAPTGSSRFMQNMYLTDRQGLSKRPGSLLTGTLSASTSPTTGFYVYKKAFGNQEIPIRAYSTGMEYYHAGYGDWTQLETGFTTGSEFGFKEHIRNIDNRDYIYYGNITEDYRRWEGNITQLNGALVGGETTVTVDGVLLSNVLYAGTATSNSATTIDVATAAWAVDQWKNFYVLIKAGTHADKIRLISAGTATQITFATLTTGPGNVAFEIRQTAYPATGTLVIGTENVAYSAIPTQYTFTTSAVVSPHADNSPVTLKPSSYPEAPRGNRLEVQTDRMMVGNVISGKSRDSSGDVQGATGFLSVFVSKLRNAIDFTFANPRAAGEGDIVSFPEGNGQVVDVVNQEEQAYVFTKSTITGLSYSQDTSDLAVKTYIKSGIGAIGRAIKGINDIYFVTSDKRISTVGRMANKDITPQAENVGLSINRLLQNFVFDMHKGKQFKQRIFHALKSSSDASYNDITLVYNEALKVYEGLWTLPAFDFGEYLGNFYYANSRNPNVYKMFTGTFDQEGTTTYAINSQWLSNWINMTSSKVNMQGLHAVAVEGFIWQGTQNIQFDVYTDYNSSSSYTFNFGIDDEGFLDDSIGLNGYFGGSTFGITPIGTLGTIASDGSRHFQFLIYIPFLYGNFFSLGLSNDEKNAQFEITRFGMGITDEPEYQESRIMSV